MTLIALIQYPHLNPIALKLGPITIRWYGLAYVTAFLLSWVVLRRLVLQRILRVSLDDLGDMVGWLAAGVVIGGRTGWWIFYHHGYIAAEPEKWYEPFAIWHGGMSFHGGLLGVLIGLLIWSRWRRAPFLNVADCLALVTPIGLFLGRIANFINAELVGRESNVPWAMIFPGDNVPRHPSQLYEAALEGPILLAILWLLAKPLRRRGDGRIAALFVICYGIFRFLVEFTREPDPQLGFIAFGWLTMGQLLSLIFALLGVVMWVLVDRTPPIPRIQENEPQMNADKNR